MGKVNGGDIGRSNSDRGGSWNTSSLNEVWSSHNQPDVFQQGNTSSRREDYEEEELKWAALERLSTDKTVHSMDTNGKIDITKLRPQDKKLVMESILKVVEEDNERFLRRLRDRTDRVGIEIPKIEVRFENLSIEADAYVGTRALPTLLNSTLNAVEAFLGLIWLVPSKKRINKILRNVSGIVRSSRMTLLLGPPGSGKTTLLQALSGKHDMELRVSGKITYCGHEFTEFVPQRTCAYISQDDLHHGEMTVRETLDFSGRCLGVGTRYEILSELSKREQETGVEPDPQIDAFMKATAMGGQKTSLVTDYVVKILGLDICEDIMVGNDMIRGISGGQKKRLTTGEMLAGPAKALFMDEISTGLDSSTTFQIVRCMRQMVHIMDVTMIISLLQPAPETFELFDDIILLSEGHIVYQGPRENILEFFEYMGFKCPERKGIADYLQEVTSKKDQEQYWFDKNQPYRYFSPSDFVNSYHLFHLGQELQSSLSAPYNRKKSHPTALVTEKYGISNWELFKACFSREWLLMKRNSFIYVFKTMQITIMSLITMTVFLRAEMKHSQISDGGKYYGALFFSLINVIFNGMGEMAMTVCRLPVFFKQRDFLFYPAWAFGLPIWLLRVPVSALESGIWVILTYYTIGFAPDITRFFRQFLAFFCVHQMALSLFRFIAAAGRTMVIANTFGTFTMLIVFVLGGFIISKGWPINDPAHPNSPKTTVGKMLLKSRGMFTEECWYWICIGALVGFSLLFNVCFLAALTYLTPSVDSRTTMGESDEVKSNQKLSSNGKHKLTSPEISSISANPIVEGIDMAVKKVPHTRNSSINVADHSPRRGMVLPFQPLSISFNHVNYSVDMPAEMKKQGIEENRLQLLRDVSGAFRPGILTALVGISGAGKTTLMDVLAGRKTGGYIEGIINISGYPKNQETFARVSGYCEQNDIHSPNVTVYESILYSAWLRLSPEVKKEKRKMFVEEVMELVELDPLRNVIVGLPGVNGLATEQRKRLTVAVELVANPSIIFMDEPTSGLDARAAAIVMRTVRNTVDTGRTVVCTIHQPSIDIFEAFDEACLFFICLSCRCVASYVAKCCLQLLLMKRGGQVIYGGPLGHHSYKLIEYFESIPGVPRIKDGYNPATWMLEVTAPSVETQLKVDFAQAYANSTLYQRTQELINELSSPVPGSEDLHFPTKYSQGFPTQCIACFQKQHWSYWRNPQYNSVRFLMTFMFGFLFGVIFWDKGRKTGKQQDLLNLLGAMYAAVMFLGATNASSVQSVVSIERTVFYRERAAGMYSSLAYAFSQVAIEVTYVAIQTLVYTLLIYSMIGFEWQLHKFIWFYYFIFMCFVYFTMCGMMMVALTSGYQMAAIVMSFIYTLWNLFAGFLIPRPQIPIWWRWYYWASPVSWTLYGLVTSQVGDKNTPLEIPGQAEKIMLQDFLKDNLGFEYNFLGYVALGHLGFVLLFFFVFAYCIKFLNFQRR
ncbi:hypothetical protein MKX01_004632 [Papaver californicum]|nr:hypothetical protein MKX01_004632 [Papaver californicum]